MLLIIVYVICLAAIIYFFLLRPQQKRKKLHAQQISSLQEGNEILTIGGLFGTVTDISADRITIVVKGGTEMEFSKMAIAEIVQEKKAENIAVN